jgi:L-aspartate oxidase
MKQADFIVIGSGISGLNFALNASKKGRVLVITKKEIIESTTNYAQGGVAAVLSHIDNFNKHIKDTLKAGVFHNNKKAVELMVKNGPEQIKQLLKIGVNFDFNNDKLSLAKEGGHSEKRIAHVKDRTGHSIEKALIKKVRSNPNINIIENCFAIDLLVKNNACHGVRVLHNNTIKNLFSSAVILATGGAGQVYKNTTNPKISTGDGIAMAKRAGAKLKDTEFVQFHPTALNLKGKKKFLLSEALRGEGAYLRNSNRNRFMHKYHKNKELAPRDIVSRAIYNEEKNGPVYLDITHKDAGFIKERFSYIYKNLKKYGLDLTKDLIPVSPAAHYLCGGIKVNLSGETTINYLFAFGEVACTGVHGANRLASNSLLEAIVFSARIAKSLNKTNNLNHPKFKIESKKPKKRPNYIYIRKKIKKIMWKKAGIVRNKADLKEAYDMLNKIKNNFEYSNKDIYALETRNMLETALQITKAAKKRKKSLGCHYVS